MHSDTDSQTSEDYELVDPPDAPDAPAARPSSPRVPAGAPVRLWAHEGETLALVRNLRWLSTRERSVVAVLDLSASMMSDGADAILIGAVWALLEDLPDGASVTVVAFAERTRVLVDVRDLRAPDRQRAREELDALRVVRVGACNAREIRLGTRTHTWSALRDVFADRPPPDADGEVRMLFTDGLANDPVAEHNAPEWICDALLAHAPPASSSAALAVHVVALSRHADVAMARALAARAATLPRVTAGFHYFADAASMRANVREVFEQVRWSPPRFELLVGDDGATPVAIEPWHALAGACVSVPCSASAGARVRARLRAHASGSEPTLLFDERVPVQASCAGAGELVELVRNLARSARESTRALRAALHALEACADEGRAAEAHALCRLRGTLEALAQRWFAVRDDARERCATAACDSDAVYRSLRDISDAYGKKLRCAHQAIAADRGAHHDDDDDDDDAGAGPTCWDRHLSPLDDDDDDGDGATPLYRSLSAGWSEARARVDARADPCDAQWHAIALASGWCA
jgi:hypothetical protein